MSSSDLPAAVEQTTSAAPTQHVAESAEVTPPHPTTSSATPSDPIDPTPSSTPPTTPTTLPATLPATLLSYVWWLGATVLTGLETVGESLAGMLGITSSRYQYVIDAKEREERWRRYEEAEEEEARLKLEETQRQQQTQQQSSLEQGNTASRTADAADAPQQTPSQAIAET